MLGTDENEQVFANIELSSTVASRLAADWAGHHSTVNPPTTAIPPPITQLFEPEVGLEQTFPSGFYDVMFDPSSSQPYMSMGQYNPTLGPFLPLSPIDATFLRANNLNEQQGRSVSSSTSTGTTVQNSNPPRHVSSSAYPLTPLSVDPDNLPGLGNWGDRQASFAAAASVGIDMTGGHDKSIWDDADDEGDTTPTSMPSDKKNDGKPLSTRQGGHRFRLVGQTCADGGENVVEKLGLM